MNLAGKRTIVIIGILVLALFVRVMNFTRTLQFIYDEKNAANYIRFDSAVYYYWGKSLASGTDFIFNSPYYVLEKETYLMTPLYPMLISGMFKLTDNPAINMIILQLLAGVAVCLLVFLITETIFGFLPAVVSALFCVFYSVSIFYEGLLLTPAFITLLNLSGFYLFLRGFSGKRAYFFFLSGILLGLSCVLRGNAVVLPVILTIYLLFKEKKSAFILFLGTFICLVPAGIRNYRVSGSFNLFTPQSGVLFYLGNNPDLSGTYTLNSDDRKIIFSPLADQIYFRNEAEKITEKKISFNDSSHFWFKKSLRIIMSEPVKYLKYLVKKFLLFWNGTEITLNYPFSTFRSQSILGLLPDFYLYSPVILTSFLFLLFFQRKNELEKVYLAVFVSYALAVFALVVVSDHRYPAVMLMMPLAGYFVKVFFERKFLLRIILITCLAVSFLPDILTPLPSYKSGELYGNALMHLRKGNARAVPRIMGKAFRLNPDKSEFNTTWAGYFYLSGKFNLAEVFLKKSLAYNPDSSKSYFYLGNIAFMKKQPQKALNELEKAVKINPRYTNAWISLAITYDYLKMPEKAKSAFLKVIEINPVEPEILSILNAPAKFNQ